VDNIKPIIPLCAAIRIIQPHPAANRPDAERRDAETCESWISYQRKRIASWMMRGVTSPAGPPSPLKFFAALNVAR
jgi:hypothetical protein